MLFLACKLGAGVVNSHASCDLSCEAHDAEGPEIEPRTRGISLFAKYQIHHRAAIRTLMKQNGI